MRISTADFIKNFGPRADQAMNAPLTITKHGRDRLVILSAEEYGRLTRQSRGSAKRRDLAMEDHALFGLAETTAAYRQGETRRRRRD